MGTMVYRSSQGKAQLFNGLHSRHIIRVWISANLKHWLHTSIANDSHFQSDRNRSIINRKPYFFSPQFNRNTQRVADKAQIFSASYRSRNYLLTRYHDVALKNTLPWKNIRLHFSTSDILSTICIRMYFYLYLKLQI